jgi:uncharacterized protein (DUF4415 family)
MKDGGMSSHPLSAELREQAERLARLPEDSIDTSDIPEAPEENWKYARRPALEAWMANRVELDPVVIDWFKKHADGGEYQEEINRVLRRHVSSPA